MKQTVADSNNSEVFLVRPVSDVVGGKLSLIDRHSERVASPVNLSVLSVNTYIYYSLSLCQKELLLEAFTSLADRSAPVLAQIVGHRLGQHLVDEHLRPLLLPPQLPGLR